MFTKMLSKLPFQQLFILFLISSFIIFGCATPEPIVEEPVEEEVEEDPEPDVLTLEYLKSLSDEELKERDSDNDGITDYDEIYVYGTDPLSADTDGDGLSDYEEIYTYNTDPLVYDMSNDGISDFESIYRYGTDRYNPDSDGDGISDGDEVNVTFTDPLNPQSEDQDVSDYEVAIEPALERIAARAAAHEEKVVVLYYDLSEYLLDEDHKERLTEVLNSLSQDRRSVVLYGYADPSGFQEYNEMLSRRRAFYIKEFLKNEGIPENRLQFVGKGIDRHEDCESHDCPESRRVEVWLRAGR